MAAIKRVDRPDCFVELANASMKMGETNDCAVKAVAVVCNVPYPVAHGELKKCGRKERRGTYSWMTLKAIAALGKTAMRVDPRSIIENYPQPHTALKGITTHHPRRFPKAWDKNKVYLLRTNGHILAVRGGVTIDWTINKALRVKEVWEVV